jgi:alpha-amylase
MFFQLLIALAIFNTVLTQYNNTLAVNQWVLIQTFDWAALSDRGGLYPKITSDAANIASAGINAAWLPPPSQSVDLQGYLPQQWYSLVSESNLNTCISSLTRYGIAPLADVVVNHRTAPSVDSCTGKYTKFSNPDMGNWAVTKDDENCASNQSCCGNYDTGDVVTYAPDLDHTNTQVQSLVKDYLSFLKNKGYTGFRFDMVKGYSASYVGNYLAASSPIFAVGEYWDSNVNLVSTWIDNTGSRSQAFDFPLRYTLKDAISKNNYASMGWMLPGVIGKNPSHSVTFLDNHDTYRDDRFGSTDQLIMGYAYLLTHPGTPCVFWTDWNIASIQSAIKTLIAVRRAAGITSTSSFNINSYTSGLYAAYVNNNVAVKLGTGSWSPSDTSYKLSTSGSNYAVWKK